MFMQDSGETAMEQSELAIKTFCPSVDITGTEIREIKRVAEGSRYRTYVLVALPTGDANLLQKRKDALEAAQRGQKRSAEAFKELDAQ
jgi:predicted ATPase